MPSYQLSQETWPGIPGRFLKTHSGAYVHFLLQLAKPIDLLAQW
jgi:hypothetical protein